MSYKLKGAESIPLDDLVNYSIDKGFKVAPLDVKMISKAMEAFLYIKTRDGKRAP
jgi:hypothetical protein